MCDERWDAAGFIEDMYRRRKFRVIEQHFPDGRVVQHYPELEPAYRVQELINWAEDELFVLQREALLIGAVRCNPYVFAPRWQKPLWWLLDRIGGW